MHLHLLRALALNAALPLGAPTCQPSGEAVLLRWGRGGVTQQGLSLGYKGLSHHPA